MSKLLFWSFFTCCKFEIRCSVYSVVHYGCSVCNVHAMNTGLFLVYTLRTKHLTSDLQHVKKDQNRYWDLT
jgi:hypothetical protein